jgi:hypothetical protein
MATELTSQTSEPDNGGKSFSDIVQKTKNILVNRDNNGFLTKTQNNADGSITEKYSYTDTINLAERAMKLAKMEETEKYADDIYKPIRMVNAL